MATSASGDRRLKASSFVKLTLFHFLNYKETGRYYINTHKTGAKKEKREISEIGLKCEKILKDIRVSL